MNRTAKILTLLLTSAVLGMTTACISVTYEGVEDLQPLPSDAKVGVYYEKSLIPVPESQYTRIGEVTASGSTSSYTLTQIKARVVKDAREKGANGVLIQSVDMKKTGEVRGDQVKNLNAPTWTTVDNSASNITQARDALIYSSGQDPDIPTYTITIKAMLFSMPETALKASLERARGTDVEKKTEK